MNTSIRQAVPAALSPLLSFISPTLPLVYICTAMVAVDCYTAWRLSRRVARKLKSNKDPTSASNLGKFSSHKLSRTFSTLAKIYAALLLAHGVDTAIFAGHEFLLGLNLTKLVAAAIVLWQTLSILENESSCSDNRWAAPLRRFLIDKSSRHLKND